MNYSELWNNFLEKIKTSVSSLTFNTWFQDTELLKMEDGNIYISVPSEIHKKHLVQKYSDLIKEVLNNVTGTNFETVYVVKGEPNEIIANYNKKEEVGVPIKAPKTANLNPNYTFESFIVGDSNRFAHAAAVAVAENPGLSYNPLFIYGKSGVGKTHLMHAIGNYILNTKPDKNVLYVTSENFINDFVEINKREHNKNNFESINEFKDKYRNVDVLIIDDIQFLAGAEKTQDEFFHTFNTLYDLNKQIIISSDRSPDDLKLLEERLRTRFNWGLTVDIQPPDYELRVEILKKKIQAQGVADSISQEVVDFIANNCDSDVRQLEGAITRLYAYAAIMNKPDINLELAIEALKDYISNSSLDKDGVRKIQRIIADYYNITVEDLKSKRRINSIAYPRQIAMYLSRELTDASFPKIGSEFGGRDHSTVVHACDKINSELKTNLQLQSVIEELKKRVKGER